MSGEVLVEMEGVAKRWGDAVGLAPTSFDLRAGEVVALSGRSGSGKSTLLAMLAGWCEPDEGHLARRGAWAEPDWRPWRSTAIVPQVLGLAEELSVAENLELVLRLADGARPPRPGPVEDLLVALDLTAEGDRLPREVSLGQQQRTAVGRAVIVGPGLLLADEPTCHQDPDHAAAVLAALRGVAADGGAVLVATHDPAVMSATDRVVSLDG